MVALRCRLLRGTFEGERADAPGLPEWPPSWMRLFSALVSAAEPGSADDHALRLLEEAPPPQIRASRAKDVLNLDARRTAWVPTNAVETKGGHATLPGRKNAERSWSRVAPRRPVVFFVWPDLELSDADAAHLSRLCRRVPYLGRTTSPALIDLIDENQIADLGWTLSPRPAPDPGVGFVSETTMRTPFRGALDELRRAHQAKYEQGEPGDPWQIGAWLDYGHRAPAPEEPGIDLGPLGSMVAMEIQGSALDGRLAARVTAELRRAIRSRADRDIAAIHGHHGGDVSQCCFVALPFTGAEHADGHLLGLAVALPRGLPTEDIAVVGRALPAAGQTMDLTCGRLGVLSLRRLAPLDLAKRAWGLQPERWRGPANRWVTAYPIVFDRYLKRRDDPVEELRRTVERSGYPAPREVVLSRHPLLPGALDLSPGDTVRRRGDGGFKPYTHAELRFDRPVEGPVIVGSMRHYGLGLCVPLDEGSPTKEPADG